MTYIHQTSISYSDSSAPKVWRIGKYIRLSRDDGNSESESITNQRKILDEQIAACFDGSCFVTDEYIDDGRTGTSDDTRPEFMRLTSDVKNGRINCIVTKNLSRAFRNSANQGKFLEEFIPLYNTRFISLYEPRIDTYLNPEVVHSLEVSSTGFINEQYAYKTSLDVRRTFDTKRKSGEFIGAFAPYGYLKDPVDKNHLVVDPEAAKVVKDIFHWFADDGMSKRGIVLKLNEMGISNPTIHKRRQGLNYWNPQIYNNDGLWSEKTVHDILRNRTYTGCLVQGRQKVLSYKLHRRVQLPEKDWYIVKDVHVPIVSPALFEKAQARSRLNTRTAPGQTQVHLFSGLLRCADCQKSMTRKTSKNNVYYCCSTYTRKSKFKCTRHSIHEDRLKEAVLFTLQKQIELLVNLHQILKTIEIASNSSSEATQIDNQLLSQNKELKKLSTVQDQLHLDLYAGILSSDDYTRLYTRLKDRSCQLQKSISALKERSVSLKNSASPYLDNFLSTKNISKLEHSLLTELIHSIQVHENGKVTINFRFSDPFPSNEI